MQQKKNHALSPILKQKKLKHQLENIPIKTDKKYNESKKSENSSNVQ